MLGLGFWEIVIIGLIALVVIGPERLPEFAKSIAKFLNEMKRTASDLKTAFDDEKDIFKEDIDQIQKLKKDFQSLPDSLKENKQLKTKNYEIDPKHEAEMTSLYDESDLDQQSLNLELEPSVSSPEQINQKKIGDSEKGDG
jgi:sec-independent protein translocase protein TatB